MAEPTLFWPSGLPQFPQRTSYSHALGNNTVRTTMEFGPAKTRRRSSAQPSIINATYLLREKHLRPGTGETVDQKRLFLQFYEMVDCRASFWLPDPDNTDMYILVKMRASGDEEGVTLSYAAPGLWSVTLSMEAHPLVPGKPRF